MELKWQRLSVSSNHCVNEDSMEDSKTEEKENGLEDDFETDKGAAGGGHLELNNNKLHKKLRSRDCLAIVIGIMIGSGIFSSPGITLSGSGNASLCLLAWTLSGILVITTATCYFELHSILPHAGGDYNYLQAAYGDRAAFSFAWFNLIISKTGSQAIISTIFGRYCEQILLFLQSPTAYKHSSHSIVSSTENETLVSKSLAVLLIVSSTALNCMSVTQSTTLQNILTLSKLCCILGLFVAAALIVMFNPSQTHQNAFHVEPTSTQEFSIFRFGSSMVACLWSFDGWCDLNFMSEELIHPKRLPKIVMSAIGIVTVVYILVMWAYLSLLTSPEIVSASAIGMVYGRKIDDTISHMPDYFNFSLIISLIVVISTASSVNGSIMTGARAFYAVARDGKFPSHLAKVSSAGSPYIALLAQGAWTIFLLVLPGSSFSTLLDYFGPTSWVFYALSASAVITLRSRGLSTNPDADIYRVPLYPLPPLVTIGVASLIVISSLMRSPVYTLLAFSFVSLAAPFHFLFLERKVCSLA